MSMKLNAVVIAQTENGREMLVSCPFGRVNEGDMILTTGGTIAKAVEVVDDFNGEIREVAGHFVTVHQIDTIWSRTWNREEEQARCKRLEEKKC